MVWLNIGANDERLSWEVDFVGKWQAFTGSLLCLLVCTDVGSWYISIDYIYTENQTF